MKKTIKYLIVLMFAVRMVNGQIDTLWTEIFNGPGGGLDMAEDIAVDLSGNVYVAGTIDNAGGNQDIGTVKYNSDGVWQWSTFYAGPVDVDDATAIAIDDLGQYVYTIGYVQADALVDYDWVLISMDAATGDTLWTRVYGTPNFFEAPTHVAVGHSGDIYVAGMAQASPGYDSYTIRKYDKYGNFLGMEQIEEAPGAQPEAFLLDDDENVYLSGTTALHTITYTIKYDKFFNIQWFRTTMDTLSRERRGFAMAVDDSGNVYVTGFCNGTCHDPFANPDDTIPDYFILSYTASGTKRYWKEYSCSPVDSSDAAAGVVVDNSGQYIYVTGVGNGGTSSLRDIWTMKIVAAIGDTVWTRKFNGPYNGNDVTAGWNGFGTSPFSIPMVMDPSGNIIYIAGSIHEPGSSIGDYLIIAYDTAGNLLGSHVLNIGYDDESKEITLGPDGNPYVTGIGEVMPLFDDFLTVKYFLDAIYPKVPTIISPLNYARLPELQPTLSFYSTDPESDDIDYQVIWDTDPDFASPESSITASYPSGAVVNFVFPNPLIDAETYWWKVKARDPGGSNCWTSYCNKRSFTIELSLPPNTCNWFQTTGDQFSNNIFYGTKVQGDSVVLGGSGSTVIDTLLEEHFEGSGIPAGWTVIDGNSDGFMWEVGTTDDIGDYPPPNYGTKYAYYSDEDAGSGVANLNEELISPAVYIPNTTEQLELIYDYGFQLRTIRREFFEVKVRFFSSGVWGSWDVIALYELISESGTEVIDLTSYLPADSVQVEWMYSDAGPTYWGYACACDNVILRCSYTAPANEGTMTSARILFHDLSTTYPRSGWGNIVWHKASGGDSIGIQVEYYDGNTWALVPDGDLPGNAVGFYTGSATGSFSVNNLDTLTYNTLRLLGLFYRKGVRAPNDPALLDWEVGNLGGLDLIPPKSPYIPVAQKVSGTDVKLYWDNITQDTLGNLETVDHYVIYRGNNPAFVPGLSDSIGGTADTFYTDVGALGSSESYYYLVKAVDGAKNRSRKSNMAYKFNRFFNENASATDKNWVSLPYYSVYTTVSDLTTDLSASGNPLEKITNLRDDQNCESWLWDPDFFEWGGANFTIQSGRGYEMVTIKDTSLLLVGANNPVGLINLNENPSATDKNWVSIPYNAVYSTVSDITTEYSPAGAPLVKLTNLRDDQNCESWIWDPDFFEWGGANFAIQPGRAYELVTIKDTFWNPTEYTNEARQMDRGLPPMYGRDKWVGKLDLKIQLGKNTESERGPVWFTPPRRMSTIQRGKHAVKQHDFEAMRLRTSEPPNFSTSSYREAGVSHIVRCHLDIKGLENLIFTAYRTDKPCDAITENIIGSCIMKKYSRAAIWFDVANFKTPWEDKEEVILIIEAVKQDRGYFAVVNFLLDNSVDIQELKDVSLIPICWDEIDDKNVIGYSLYQGDKRLNKEVITVNEYSSKNPPQAEEITLKPVVKGGYETVYGSGIQGEENALHSTLLDATRLLEVYPNPFSNKTDIRLQIPDNSKVSLRIYDVTGRLVRTLPINQLTNLKSLINYVSWDGTDDIGRRVSPGVYFIQMNTEGFESRHKVIFVH